MPTCRRGSPTPSRDPPFGAQSGEATSQIPGRPQVERRELPQSARPQSAYRRQRLAAARRRCAAILSGCAAGVSGGGRGLALLCSAAPAGRTGNHRAACRRVRLLRRVPAGRHHHHRRHQRHAGRAGATLSHLRRLRSLPPTATRARVRCRRASIDHSASAAAAPAPVGGGAVAAAPASRPVATVVAAPSVHFVNPGETLASIARRNHVTVPRSPGPTTSIPPPSSSSAPG